MVDAGGALIAFARQDGALEGSIDLAIDKAKTARMFNKTTEFLAELAQPGAPLFGIEQSNGGHVVIFGGGLPVTIDDQIVGAVGTTPMTRLTITTLPRGRSSRARPFAGSIAAANSPRWMPPTTMPF